jgi:hypothetical protein
MSLSYREQCQLRGIEAGLFRSDSYLAAMLDLFGRLYSGQDMPASEQVPSRQNRDRRAVTRIAAALAALAISVMFSAAVALTTSVRRGRVQPSAAKAERTGPGREADGQQDPPG